MTSQAELDALDARTSGGMADTADVHIERLYGVSHAHEVEELQTAIWHGTEGWIVPSHVLLIVAEYGGILLGARSNGTLVGFVLGFLAQADGKQFHASHMLGVLPTVRHHGIGAALKWHQRECALAQGLDLMRWTFDPLESRNAYLNFHKLGTVCRSYRPDYYGSMRDALNRDLPSDRLVVDWHLRDTAPREMPHGPYPVVLSNQDGYPELCLDALEPGTPAAIQIPRDVQSMKREAPGLALAWRQAVRDAFSHAFARGYSACDFSDGAYVLCPREELHDAD